MAISESMPSDERRTSRGSAFGASGPLSPLRRTCLNRLPSAWRIARPAAAMSIVAREATGIIGLVRPLDLTARSPATLCRMLGRSEAGRASIKRGQVMAATAVCVQPFTMTSPKAFIASTGAIGVRP